MLLVLINHGFFESVSRAGVVHRCQDCGIGKRDLRLDFFDNVPVG